MTTPADIAAGLAGQAISGDPIIVGKDVRYEGDVTLTTEQLLDSGIRLWITMGRAGMAKTWWLPRYLAELDEETFETMAALYSLARALAAAENF